jgi:hypothetical protein
MTGTGESTLIETLALQDIERGNGFALIDPHGDLVARVAARRSWIAIHCGVNSLRASSIGSTTQAESHFAISARPKNAQRFDLFQRG